MGRIVRSLVRKPSVRRPPRSFVVTALVLVVVAWLFGGTLALLVGVVGVAGLLLGVRAESVVMTGLAVMVLTPVAWLVGNRSRLDTLGFDLVTANPAPQWFAVAALTLLLVGVFLDEPDRYPQPGQGHHSRDESESDV